VLTHHGPSSAPGGRFASAEALALYRLNALDAGVKGALEHGLGSVSAS
jgi:3'-5' exoribonuclease